VQNEQRFRLIHIPRLCVCALLKLYKLIISPLLPPSCRFHPTCSEYARAVIERKGVLAGGFLALRRLLKCHPFHPGGFDPPPA